MSSLHSLTAILISRFLIDLQEANHRSVKVDSDDPAYISSYSGNSDLPSFVADPAAAGPSIESSTGHIEGKILENGEEGGVNEMEDDALGVETLSLEVEV